MNRTKTSNIDITTATPIRSIRAYCLDCTGGERATVRNCSYTWCPLYPYRMGKRPPKGTAATPMKTIRKQCMECCSGVPSEVRKCPAGACSIHRYRFGRKVAATGELSTAGDFSEALTMNDTPEQSEGQKAPLFDEL